MRSVLLGDEEEPVGGSVRPLLPSVLPAPFPPLHEHLHLGHRAPLVIRKTSAEITGCSRVVVVPKLHQQGSGLRELRLTWKEMENLIFERFFRIFGVIWRIFGEIKGIFGNFELC